MIKEIAEHRSCRKFLPEAIPADVMREMLAAAVRASNTGNMQVYSIVVTTDEALLAQLRPCHFNQPAAHAPAIITFCADVRRFSRWCEQRGARPEYDNFVWFLNAMTDALLASQNLTLQAVAYVLGICYLGTTFYNAPEISEILRLPEGVIPVMALSCGYPVKEAEGTTPLTDRLPLEAVVHEDVYCDQTDEEIAEFWAEREASDETAELLKTNDLPNLARIFTERRYKGDDNRAFSRKYFDELVRKGFFNQ
jgi:nitroreductase